MSSWSILCRRARLALALWLAAAAPLFAAPEPPQTPVELTAWAAGALAKGSLFRQQKALALLGSLETPEAERLLLAQFARWQAGTLPLALWLDLFEAAARRGTPALRERLAERERQLQHTADPLVRWRECLEGGDAENGRTIFTTKPEAGCIRCHRVGDAGGEIGPNLTGLIQRSERLAILESILLPNEVVAPGFDQVLLTLKSGEVVSGIRSFEGRDEMVIVSVVDGTRRRIPAAEIEKSEGLPSAMPPGFGEVLGRRAIRDLVEFLATEE